MNIFAFAVFLNLISVVLFQPVPVFAKENLPPQYLGNAEKQIIRQALLDAYIRRFNRTVKTGADVEKQLFSRLSPKERKSIREIYANLGPAPRLSRKGDTLIFKFDKSELKVRWPDLSENQVYIEGESWVFDPSAPIKTQVDNLNEKVKAAARKGEKSALRFQLQIVPEAHAVAVPLVAGCISSQVCTWVVAGVGGAVIGTWGGKIGGALIGGAYDVSCYLLSEAGLKPWVSVGWCREWKLADLEWRKNQAAADWVVSNDSKWAFSMPTCPPKDEKGVELFHAYISEIRPSAAGDLNQTLSKKRDWKQILLKSVNDQLSEGYYFENPYQNIMVDAPDPAQRIFVFMKDPSKPGKEVVLKSVKFIKPDNKTYDVYDTSDARADVPARDREAMEKMAGMIQAVRNWATACKTLAGAVKSDPDLAEDVIKSIKEPEIKPSGPPPASQ